MLGCGYCQEGMDEEMDCSGSKMKDEARFLVKPDV